MANIIADQGNTPKAGDAYDWGHPRVPWTYNLRFTEPHQRKLEFILANRREKSMQQMLCKVIDAFIENELASLYERGILPDLPPR